MKIFDEIKEMVTTKQAAELYGIKTVSNGMACCPFHEDRHPSMKLDKRYYCFACGASGDVINFVAEMFGLSQYEAARKLNQDFSLGFKMTKSFSKEKEFRKETVAQRVEWIRNKLISWVTYAICVLTRYLRWMEFWKECYRPETVHEEWHPLFTEALNNMDRINHNLDILVLGDGEEILEFYENGREEVTRIEKRIDEYQRRVVAGIGEYSTE